MSWELDLTLERDIAYMPGVKAAIVKETEERGAVAKGLLYEARAKTAHVKIWQEYAHEAKVTTSYGGVDGFINLHGGEGTSAKSIEFGHNPSGFFDPAKYGRMTKAPEGLYILHRAAGLL